MNDYGDTGSPSSTLARIGAPGAAPARPGVNPLRPIAAAASSGVNALAGWAKGAAARGAAANLARIGGEVASPARVPDVKVASAASPAPAAHPAPAPVGFHAWAAEQVKQGGGNPDAFHVDGSQLMSSRSPSEISADIQAHPPITTAAGRATVAAAAAAAVPSVGVPSVGIQGPASAAAPRPSLTAPAMAQADPARAALQGQMAQAHRDAQRYGQGQWVFPPGTGTEAVWQPNTAHERVAAYGKALADYNQTDPAAKLGVLHSIAHADPATRAVGIASLGVEPAAAAAMPRPAAQNEPVDPSGLYDSSAAASYADPKVGLREHLIAGASRPGIADPNHPNHKALQDWVNKRFADQDEWNQETFVPGDYQFSGPSFLEGPARMWAGASTGLFGPNQQQRQEQATLLKRFGIQPPGTVPPQ